MNRLVVADVHVSVTVSSLTI